MIDYQLIQELKSKKILIVGLGKTGLSVAKFLIGHGIQPVISDSRSLDELDNDLSKLGDSHLIIYEGDQKESQLQDVDLVILSPGVPRSMRLVKVALQWGIPVVSEIEFAFQLCAHPNIVSVTGTDGKTTTATLIHRLIETEKKVYLAGNVGLPFIDIVNDLSKEDWVVLELSSYQLEDNPTFKSHISIFLNIDKDHLDRYDHFEDYFKAKCNIFNHHTEEDIAILNADDPYLQGIQYLKSQQLTFSSRSDIANCYSNDKGIYYHGQQLIALEALYLRSTHLIEDMMAAICAAKIVGITDKSIHDVIVNFKGLEHRMEKVGNSYPITFINDSKATTVHAVKAAIQSISSPIHLIIGGRNKNLDFSELSPLIREKVRACYIFGESRERIAKEIAYESAKIADGLEDVMALIKKSAAAGETVLFSPGCASFDQYKNYAERGAHFKELVSRLWHSHDPST